MIQSPHEASFPRARNEDVADVDARHLRLRGHLWRLADVCAFFGLAIVAGSSFLFIKEAKRTFPSFTLVALRLSIGFVVLACITAVFFGRYTVKHMLCVPMAGKLLFMGVFNNVIPYSLYPFAEDYVNIGVAAILAGTAPLFSLVLAHAFVNGERLTIYRVAGMLVALAGIIIVSLQKFDDGSLGWGWGEFGGYSMVLVAAACKGAASVFAHYHLVDHPIVPVACGQTLFGSTIAITLSLCFDIEWPPHGYPKHYGFFPNASWKAIGGILYLGLGSSCIAYVLQFYLIQHIGTVRQMLTDFIVPCVAIVEGAVILGNWSGASWWYITSEVVGAVLIAIGVSGAHVHRREPEDDVPPLVEESAARARGRDASHPSTERIALVSHWKSHTQHMSLEEKAQWLLKQHEQS